MQTAGLIKHLRERMLTRTKPPVLKHWQKISLDEVVPTISIFILGVLVALLVLGVECLTTGLEHR
jgi:hypothetical protein